jgi:hypothetical protein
MSRSKKYMAATILSASMLFTSAAREQTATPQNDTPYQRPCSLLTKAEAELIVGASLVVHRDNNEECWYVEDGFTNPTGPRNRQVYLNIWHNATPQSDEVNIHRQRIAATVTRDVPDFADAALWTWTAGMGRFSAFKGGTIGVDIIVGGIAENAALQNEKKLAARVLGGAGRSGYTYAGAPGSPLRASTPASRVQSPTASPPRMPDLQQAREIWRFDELASDDQIEYVNLLIDSVEAAIQPEQLAQVKRFFASKQAGETMSGMGQFELNLSLARVADLEAVEKYPKVRRLEVEDVMYVTLVVNGIALPKSFRPAAINFQPKRPSGTAVTTKAEAYKALAQTQAWVGRTVPLDRELPTGPGTWNRGGFGLALFRSLAEGQAKAEANGEPGLKSFNQGTSDGASKPYNDIVHEAEQRAKSAATSACFEFNMRQMTSNTLRRC